MTVKHAVIHSIPHLAPRGGQIIKNCHQAAAATIAVSQFIKLSTALAVDR
jgi:hypothetical protein